MKDRKKLQATNDAIQLGAAKQAIQIELDMGRVLAAIAKRFNYGREERRIIAMNEYVQHAIRWILEEVKLREPPSRDLIIDEGQTGTILLRNKDGTTSKFDIEAASHKLWLVQR